MNLLKMLVAGAAAGVILVAFRDFENQRWMLPTTRGDEGLLDDEEEPVLGYDGMDQETLIDWLGNAGLDRSSLLRARRYETANRRREPVLAAIGDLLA